VTLLGRTRRILLGDDPKALLVLAAPTLLAIIVDLVLRARAMALYAWHGKLFYIGSVLESAAFWVLPLWFASRLAAAAAGPRASIARPAHRLFFALWVFPLVTFCFGAQILFHDVFDAYIGRDTVRLGITFRGTLAEWFGSSGGPWLLAAMLGAGALITLALVRIVRRVAPRTPARPPLVAVVTFAAALGCFWFDLVDSRYLQAATPDTCLLHGAVHALRVAVTGHWGERHGVSLRTPVPIPALESERARRPNVLVILTESVRADAMCSDPPPACTSSLDAVAADRIPLGKLTTQTPNTFSSCMILWTGLPPSVDFVTAHSSPVLWELAKAAGYRTAYVTSQNPSYEDFAMFVRRAGIDVLVTATELGGMAHEQLGAPDERATEAMARFLREVPAGTPYFGVLHLANTHSPYRVADDLQPNAPHTGTPVGGMAAFHNHYRNSVLLQERTLGAFLGELRATPGWDDTAVVFLSDHGEQFREHHGLYHNHTLYDEELRVPGWLLAGPRALDDEQRAAPRSYDGRRTFMQDVHATIVDLLGLTRARATLPYAGLVTGRSLLRPHEPGRDPVVLLATTTAVWEADDTRYGAQYREQVVIGSPSSTWRCLDMKRDPGEHAWLPAARCGKLVDAARSAFADVP
jgi:arylsulfatase A-like enzyme